jgi:hypothetical protein
MNSNRKFGNNGNNSNNNGKERKYYSNGKEMSDSDEEVKYISSDEEEMKGNNKKMSNGSDSDESEVVYISSDEEEMKGNNKKMVYNSDSDESEVKYISSQETTDSDYNHNPYAQGIVENRNDPEWRRRHAQDYDSQDTTDSNSQAMEIGSSQDTTNSQGEDIDLNKLSEEFPQYFIKINTNQEPDGFNNHAESMDIHKCETRNFDAIDSAALANIFSQQSQETREEQCIQASRDPKISTPPLIIYENKIPLKLSLARFKYPSVITDRLDNYQSVIDWVKEYFSRKGEIVNFTTVNFGCFVVHFRLNPTIQLEIYLIPEEQIGEVYNYGKDTIKYLSSEDFQQLIINPIFKTYIEGLILQSIFDELIKKGNQEFGNGEEILKIELSQLIFNRNIEQTIEGNTIYKARGGLVHEDDSYSQRTGQRIIGVKYLKILTCLPNPDIAIQSAVLFDRDTKGQKEVTGLSLVMKQNNVLIIHNPSYLHSTPQIGVQPFETPLGQVKAYQTPSATNFIPEETSIHLQAISEATQTTKRVLLRTWDCVLDEIEGEQIFYKNGTIAGSVSFKETISHNPEQQALNLAWVQNNCLKICSYINADRMSNGESFEYCVQKLLKYRYYLFYNRFALEVEEGFPIATFIAERCTALPVIVSTSDFIDDNIIDNGTSATSSGTTGRKISFKKFKGGSKKSSNKSSKKNKKAKKNNKTYKKAKKSNKTHKKAKKTHKKNKIYKKSKQSRKLKN